MHLKVNLLFSTLLLVSTVCYCKSDFTKSYAGEYDITLDKTTPLVINVKAKLLLSDDSVYINQFCPSFKYTEGWASFIKNLRLRNGMPLKFIGNSRWSLANNMSEIELEYQVDLSFVKERWDVGNEQAGTLIDEALFVVSRSLFIYGQPTGKFLIRFNMPDNWKVATSWKSLAGISNIFEASSLDKLINNTVVWGIPVIKNIRSGNFNLQVALLGDVQKKESILTDVFKKSLTAYKNIFDFKDSVNYLITLFYAAQQDGESYATGNAFTLKDEITEGNKMMWANQLAHELFHFWNGRTLQPAVRNEMQWFNEGFTEYYTNLVLLQTGIISEETYWQKQEKQVGLYAYFRRVQYPDISMIKASAQKSMYRFGIYNGGAVTAFVLDILIQEKTKGVKNLDDLMKYMLNKHGLNGKSFVLSDLEDAIKNISGFDAKDFFNRHIRGVEMLPFEEILHKIGYNIAFVDYEAEAFIQKKNIPESLLLLSWKKRISVR